MISYLWAVNNLTSYPQYEGKEDVVFNVQWCCNGLEDGISGVVYGSTDVVYKATEPFTPYNQLTIEQVIGWVKEALGAEETAKKEAEVADIIAQKKQPPSQVTLPLPWNVPAPAPAPEPTPEPQPEPIL